MKKIPIQILLLLCLVWLSCTQTEGVQDRLQVQVDEQGMVNIVDTQTHTLLLQSVTAALTDGNGRTVVLPADDLVISTRTFHDKMGAGTETVLQSVYHDLHLQWSLRTLLDHPVVLTKLDVVNTGKESMRIDRLSPLVSTSDSSGFVYTDPSGLRYLDIQPITWNWVPKAVQQLDSTGSGHFVSGVAGADDQGLVIGAFSMQRFRASFAFRDNRAAGHAVGLTAEHAIDAHMMLEPGQTLASEWIYLDATNDVLTGLEQWAELAGKYNNAVFADPPATGFYTWYYYRDRVSEKIMLENAKFLAENRDRFPVNWVHIDWGWQRKYSTGDTVANAKFPHGLKWLANEIRELGFHPSIWCNPFMYTQPTADAPANHPDIFLQYEHGGLVERKPIRNIMGEDFGDMEYTISPGVTNIIDVSNPDAYAFLSDRYSWVRGLGYDMAMMDFIQEAQTREDENEVMKYNNVSKLEGVRRALTAAQAGLGRDKGILGCGTIYEPSIGISTLTRISTDAPAIWSCVKTACNDLLSQYFMNNRLWTNYADGLFVRDKVSPYWRDTWWDENNNLVPMYLSDDEAEFYTTVTGMSQAAVMYTEDIARLKPHRQHLLSMVLPIFDQGEFRPVDLFRSTPPKTLQLVCSQGSRNWTVAAGLNWTDEIVDKGLDLALLDLQPDVQYHAFNVYKKQYLGRVNASEKQGPVNPHGVLLVNLTPVQPRPQVVGTDTHISQGGVEIADETWDADAKTLTVYTKDLYGRKGHFYVFAPDGYACANHKVSSRALDNGTLLSVPVMLDGEKTLILEF